MISKNHQHNHQPNDFFYFPDIPQDAIICKTFDHFKFGDDANDEDLSRKEEIFNAYEYEPVALSLIHISEPTRPY